MCRYFLARQSPVGHLSFDSKQVIEYRAPQPQRGDDGAFIKSRPFDTLTLDRIESNRRRYFALLYCKFTGCSLLQQGAERYEPPPATEEDTLSEMTEPDESAPPTDAPDLARVNDDVQHSDAPPDDAGSSFTEGNIDAQQNVSPDEVIEASQDVSTGQRIYTAVSVNELDPSRLQHLVPLNLARNQR